MQSKINVKNLSSHFKKGIAAILIMLFTAALFTACGEKKDDKTVRISVNKITEAGSRPNTDREGYAIILPEKINRIITIGPSNTEILAGLGFAANIIAADMYSSDVAGLSPNTQTVLDMMSLDAEYIINLMPDVIFITGMSRGGSEDNPLAAVSRTGITIIFIPTSISIAEIMEDIRFIAAVMDVKETGENIISYMQAEIDRIKKTAQTITEKRKVYFEISPAPWMYSFGADTFLNEMIELTGAVNIFSGQTGWLSVSDEALLSANPDVILTSTYFLDDPAAEITGRPGFGVITAVQNGNVFYIDSASSSRPSQNLILALNEISNAVYPEYYR